MTPEPIVAAILNLRCEIRKQGGVLKEIGVDTTGWELFDWYSNPSYTETGFPIKLVAGVRIEQVVCPTCGK